MVGKLPMVTYVWAGKLSCCGEGGGTGGDHSERGDIRARHLLIFHTFYTIVTSFLYFTLLTLEATFLLDEWIYKN